MKTVRVWTFISVTVIALTAGRGSLRAQPAGDAVTLEGDDKPWNQGVPRAVRQEARAIFLEGNRLFNIPLIAQAVEQYTLALGKWKHPAFYFNLALADLSLGRNVEARDNFELALQHGEEPLGSDRFREAQKQRQNLERKLGRIRVSCQTDGTEVTLDGSALFTAPGSREVWVAPRAHEVTAKRADYLSEARRVTVAAGEIKRLDLRLVTLSEAEEDGRRWSAWKPWAVVATGGVIAASAGALHILSVTTFHDYDNKFGQLHCAQNGGCPRSAAEDSLNRELSRAQREQRVAVGGYIAGGSVLIAGAVLVYLNRPHLLEQPVSNSPAGRVAIVPAVSPSTLGVLLTVSH